MGRLIWETGGEPPESEVSTVCWMSFHPLVPNTSVCLHCCCKSWSSQTDDGTVGGASSGYDTLPVLMFRLQHDLRAVPPSSFSCCSLYSVQQHLTHTLCKVGTLHVHTGITLHILTHGQVNHHVIIKHSFIICTHSSSRKLFSGIKCLGARFDPDISGFLTTGYVSMDSLPKYSGDLWDYQPGCLRCFNCEAPCCAPHT